MKNKRIAMISYHTCPLASQEGKETGGMNVYVLELAKELIKKNCIVDIYTRSQDKHHEKIVTITPALRVIHLPAGPQKSVQKKNLLSFINDFVANYFTFVNTQNISYDILHCHYYLSGLIGLKIEEKTKLPIFMSFHTLALMKNLVARSEHEEETPERIAAEFVLSKKVKKIITSSQTDALYLQYLYNASAEKLVVIPPGIDANRFHPIEKSLAKKKIREIDKKIVLFVGRIEPLKGIDALIYAMKIVVTRNPHLPVKLLIAGGDLSQPHSLWTKEMQKLRQLRITLKIPNIVQFVGQRSQEELPLYYNSAEIVIMPSHYESFGIAALEAMACGTPVITSNVSGVASIIDKQREKLITTVNNPLLLASQIEHLLTDEEEYLKVSQGVRNKVADLTWSNTAHRMIKVYNSL